jgi:signal transduction histidine kinase/CheY-like chemotaxis protein/sugar lactone lactonase YvrE
MVIRLYFVLLIFVPFAAANAQSVRFRHITNQEGLSQNTVTALVQDQRGFLWIGTQDGLNRYDGSQFLIFKKQQDDTASLHSNWILSLAVDSRNRIWVGMSGGGLQMLAPGANGFTTVLRATTGAETSASIPALFADQEGTVWASSTEGLLFKITGDGKEQLLQPRLVPQKGVIVSMTGFGRTYIAAALRMGGLVFIERSSGLIKTADEVLSLRDELPFSRCLSVFSDDSTQVYVGTDGEGVWKLNRKGDMQRIVLPDEKTGRIPPVRNINRDKERRIWLGSDGFGAYRLDETKQTIDQFGAYFTDDYSLSDNSIYSSLLDRQGVFWIGTFLGGLNVFDAFNNRFLSLGVTTNPERTLSNPMVRALELDDRGDLWVGTRGGGVNIYHPLNRTVERPFPEQVMDQRTNALLFDAKKRMWVGTWGGGLYRVEKDGRIRHFVHDPENARALRDGRIRVLFEDRKGRVWVATGQIGQGALAIYQEETGDFATVKLNRKGMEDPAINTINHLFEDSAGKIWISTFGGLIRLSDSNGSTHVNSFSLEYFRNDPKSPGSLGHNSVNMVVERANGQKWIATYGYGIAEVSEPKPGVLTFRHITELDGLPTNGVMSLVEDRKGNLWLGTNKGIVKFSPETQNLRPFFKNDGVTSNQINQNALLKGDNGVLLFGTAGGVTLFNPERIEESRFEPRVVFTGLDVFGKPVMSPMQLTEMNRVSLTYDQNYLTISFSALDFSAPGSIQYQCFLEGNDKNWVQLGNRRIVNYTNLSPGTYFMRVRSTNSDGIWGKTEAVLEIEIVPPFYYSRWFLGLVALLSIGAIVFAIRLREQAHQRRTKELERAVEVRTAELMEKTAELEIKTREAEQANRAKSSFLAGMSHELRTPLNAILGFSQLLYRAGDLSERYREFAETMYRSGNHLLAMINDVLDISKIEAGRMEIKGADFDLNALMKDLESMFRLDCRQKNLDFGFRVDSHVPEYVHADASKVRQVLINLIGNAVKYTAHGSVTVSVSMNAPNGWEPDYKAGTVSGFSGNAVWFHVSDTGRGIPPERIATIFEPFRRQDDSEVIGTGLGLAITAELIKLLGGGIIVRSRPSIGSDFAVVLPLPIATAPLVVPSREAVVYEHVVSEKPWKVLIVDDIASNVELLRAMLTRLGFQCVLANDGADGLLLFDLERPDLVLLDLRMPGLRGEDVMREIRRRQGERHIPVFAVTASVFEGNETALINEGFDAFLVKPFHQNDLFALMEKHAGVVFEKKDRVETLAEKQTRDEQAIAVWISGLHESVRIPLIEAVQSSDLPAILQLSQPFRASSIEADILCRACETSNYRVMLTLSEQLDLSM